MIRMDLLLTAVLAVAIVYLSLVSENSPSPVEINGASLVSPPQPVDKTHFVNLKELGTNWVAIIPYAFTSAENNDVIYDHPRMWWGEQTAGTEELIRLAQEAGLQVMLKPHLWVRGQGWAGDLDRSSDADWQAWEQGYTDYILHFAAIAEKHKVPLFCIGTELRRSVQKRGAYWTRLIQDVRSEYSGKLTYAANWDNYSQVDFWTRLDYIGIDAYFPITTSISPDLEELTAGWAPTVRDLHRLAREFDREILFTEYGYRSVQGTAGNHWELEGKPLDLPAQSNAYQALYDVFWNQPWMAGGFFWKWHLREDAGGVENDRFTPQNKPAERVIERYYSQYSVSESNGINREGQF